MSPLTRFRADEAHVPTNMMIEYYEQRASVPGTMLITEATFISDEAAGYDRVPGVWSNDQVAAWKKITDAVHAKHSFIYCQLWALGRTANPEFLRKKGYDLTSASSIPADKNVPRALTEEEILRWIEAYAHAAEAAIRAGFDGVEIHGANGYLIDQFLQDVSNHRTDKWGGSIENRSRFGLAVAKAVTDAIGPDRTGIRLSPFATVPGMGMDDPEPQFGHLIEGLRTLDLAFIHVVIGTHRPGLNVGPNGAATPEMIDFVFKAWGNGPTVILAGRFEPDTAKKAVEEQYQGKEIAIGFGRHFISNPDLPYRIEHGLELTPFDVATFYAKGDPVGYSDYPFSPEFLKASL
ncbi:MAG: hypothetical protein Q9165_006552 [Trypethelium subeluteriae]